MLIDIFLRCLLGAIWKEDKSEPMEDLENKSVPDLLKRVADDFCRY